MDNPKERNPDIIKGEMSVGEGWYKLLNDLCDQLKLIEMYTGIKVEADQIKEKYGTLRFYYHTELRSDCCNIDDEHLKIWGEIIDKIIIATEMFSESRCEICGEFGSVRATPWILTLCGEHYEEYKKGAEERIKHYQNKELE